MATELRIDTKTANITEAYRREITKPARLVALKKFEKDVGVSSTTTWRWTNLGWLHPVRISNKLYLEEADIAQFLERARRGELARECSGCARKEEAA